MTMNTQLPDNWLELAASHGATKWVKRFIQTYLPQIREQSISAETFAQVLEDELRSRKLTTPAQQKNYRSNICQALKVIDVNHSAIALVSPTTEQYRELNEEQRGRLADRETKYFTSATAEILVERATALLESAEWSEVAAGLAVLVGRRISEILLSDFSLKSAWSLNFSEMSKKSELITGLVIEVPTLAPASIVLQAMQRLQKSLKIEDLKLESLTRKMAKQTVNYRYSEFVAAKCHEHFSDLVPARADGENLYSHIFRAVYATIAAHWFCPLNVPEHLYKAEIQGHFTLTKEGKKLPNYSARANYDDYAIATEDGNRDGRLGIKLGLLSGLEVIEAFRKDIREMSKETPKRDRNRIDSDKDKDKDKDSSRNSKSSGNENRNGNGGGDEERKLELVSEQLSDVSSEDVLGTKEVDIPETEVAGETERTVMIEPVAKPKKLNRRPEMGAEDLERMTRLMAKRGVAGSYHEVFEALLDTFEQQEQRRQDQESQTVVGILEQMRWFTSEIEALRGKVSDLEQEREHLKSSQVAANEVGHLRTENSRLKQELQQTQSRLEGIQRLLGVKGNPIPNDSLVVGTTEALVTPRAVELSTSSSSITEVATSSSASEPSSSVSKASAVRGHRGETTQKIHQVIDALMSWNYSQEDSQRQLRISIPTIKALASALGANYQPAIQAVLKERQAELEAHHRQLLIGSRHNATVNRKNDLLQAIARELLGLENWLLVNFS
jgi:hypothetical protein